TGGAAAPAVPGAIVVDYQARSERAYAALEAAIVGYTPAPVIHCPAPEIPATAERRPLLSGVFFPVADFEPRPELDQLPAFRTDPATGGVLALVGMGGSGKTALLSRFLQELPRSPLSDQSLLPTSPLPVARGCFVWSLYDNPNIESLVRALYEYLSG